MLLDKLEELSNDDISKSKVKDSLESYIDKVEVVYLTKNGYGSMVVMSLEKYK